MNLLGTLRRLRGNRDGSVIVEFALLAPVLLVTMFGVLQVGVTMWRYNALRSLAGDIARHAMVEYQSDEGVDPSPTTLIAWGRTKGTSQLYQIPSADLTVNVEQPATQRVTNAVEMTITVSSTVPELMPFDLMNGMTLSYSRPVFLLP